MTLFHGSYMTVKNPLVKLGRKKVDFGQGFYLTKLRRQAESWAMTIAERKGRNVHPTISSFSFDLDAVRSLGYRIKIFEKYDLEWLVYVVDCRRGITIVVVTHEGGVANDNVIDTVEDYENGIINAEQALGQLRYKEVNHQICILNQEIVDKHLTFISSETFKQED